METVEIQYLLNNAQSLKFLNGKVCSNDLLPKKRLEHRKAYVVNTDKSTEPGAHWVVLYFDNRKHATYFDSYGLPPVNNHVYRFIIDNTNSWTYTKTCVQSETSSVCGMYCIFALDHLARGYDLETILTIMFHPKDLAANDKNVKKWFEQTYGQYKH